MGRMLLLCQKFVLERLNFLTNFKHTDVIETVLNQNASAEELHEAGKIVKVLMKDWGEIIIGGDLLTVERVDQNKSLRACNMTDFEQLGFLGPSRIAVFHFRQNILLKIFASILPNLNDSSNPGTLNSFRALTDKAKDISNKENKIKDQFELHYQFIMVVAETFVEEKLVSFAKAKYGTSDLKTFSTTFKECGENEIMNLLEEIIEDTNHTIFFEKGVTLNNLKSVEDVDDLMNMGELFVSLWFLLKSLNFIVKTGDPEGIEYFKKNSLLLVLSLHSNASKYVHKGFQELVKLKGMSERMKLRFLSGHFIKYHGKMSSDQKIRPSDLNNRSEDMVCEWLVGTIKNSFKTLGGNFSEETIEKKVKAMTLVNSILDKDNKDLLLDSQGPGTSWDRFETEESDRFREYVQKLDPFRYEINSQLAFNASIILIFRSTDRKRVMYKDKNISKTLYSNLNSELIEKFFNMKLKNMQG